MDYPAITRAKVVKCSFCNTQRVIELEHISPAGFCVHANATDPRRIHGCSLSATKPNPEITVNCAWYDLIFTIESVITEYSGDSQYRMDC